MMLCEAQNTYFYVKNTFPLQHLQEEIRFDIQNFSLMHKQLDKACISCIDSAIYFGSDPIKGHIYLDLVSISY